VLRALGAITRANIEESYGPFRGLRRGLDCSRIGGRGGRGEGARGSRGRGLSIRQCGLEERRGASLNLTQAQGTKPQEQSIAP